MAQRRMISKSIINSAKFLKMPSETQALYFHLCLHADDDGIVEAFTILRTTGSSEDNLRILHAKGLVHVLNDDFVSYILDWNEHNLLRADRKINSLYQNLLLKVIPDVELLQPKQRKDRKKSLGIGFSNDDAGTSHGQPMDRLGEDSIGEDSIVEDKKSKKKTSFIPPTLDDVISYFKENGYKVDAAKKAFEGYNVADRHDTRGNKIKNWKQKMINVWFTDQNKAPKEIPKDNSHIQNIYDLSHLQGQI